MLSRIERLKSRTVSRATVEVKDVERKEKKKEEPMRRVMTSVRERLRLHANCTRADPKGTKNDRRVVGRVEMEAKRKAQRCRSTWSGRIRPGSPSNTRLSNRTPARSPEHDLGSLERPGAPAQHAEMATDGGDARPTEARLSVRDSRRRRREGHRIHVGGTKGQCQREG